MTKKQMSARIAELEAMVATLSAAINSMRTPIVVAPLPAPPLPSFPTWPPYTPFVGDPPVVWPTPGWTSAPNIGINPNAPLISGVTPCANSGLRCSVNNEG